MRRVNWSQISYFRRKESHVEILWCWVGTGDTMSLTYSKMFPRNNITCACMCVCVCVHTLWGERGERIIKQNIQNMNKYEVVYESPFLLFLHFFLKFWYHKKILNYNNKLCYPNECWSILLFCNWEVLSQPVKEWGEWLWSVPLVGLESSMMER